MPTIRLIMHDPPAWPELEEDMRAGRIMTVPNDRPVDLACIPDGMKGDDGNPRPSMMFLLRLGRVEFRRTGYRYVIF